MATVVHKTTFQRLYSVNTPDYPAGTWLINPAGLAALEAASVAAIYWKLISGDTDVGEMTAAEKYAVDQAAAATVDAAIMVTVTADPEVTAVDAPKGSIIVYEGEWYCKMDDGPTTNVKRHVDWQDEESGGSKWKMVPYSANPTPAKGDLWVLEVDGTVSLCFYDGSGIHVLAMDPPA